MDNNQIIPINRAPRWESFDVGELVFEVCARLEQQLVSKNVVTDVDVPVNTIACADRSLLGDAIEQLILNAFYATPAGSEIDIIAWNGHEGLEVEVADSRSQDDLSTTSQPNAEIQNHLDNVQRAVYAHGGEVFANNCPQGGTAFTIRIPKVAQKQAA